jgi:hypothetical protein
MNDLSTKLQEQLALNTGEMFLELVSDIIIADDTIRAHRESKKKKVMIVPSYSAPHKYWMVCATHHTHPGSIIISWLHVHRRIRTSCIELWHSH